LGNEESRPETRKRGIVPGPVPLREQSFMKSLFLGVIEEGLIFPWPEPNAQERDTVRALLETVRRFFEREVDSAKIDREQRIGDDVLRGLKELGLLGMLVPQSHGGAGLTNTGYARVVQEVAGWDPSIAVTLGAHQSIGLKGLLLFGSQALKDLYLPRLATGELMAAYALTEPGAGSDAAAIQTRAELRDGGYVLNGSKIWITNGGFADLFTVFARTSPSDVGVKPKITAFLVERGWGVKSGPNEHKLGIRGSSTTEVFFEDVRVPTSHILGEPGRGFRVAMQVLNSGRLGLASGCVGLCKRLIKLAVERCRERRAFGRPIGEFGLIKDKIASMMSQTWALESMTYLTTGMVDAGVDDYSVESAICKVYGSETCWRVANEALQIAAGIGYMASYPYERLLRDARINLIFEGTNEILRAFIALSGMQAPGRELADVARALREPIKGFGLLSDFAIRKARGAFSRERMGRHHPLLKREAVIFEEYVQQLAQEVDRVLRKHGRDIAEMQYTQKRTAELAIELYAVAACITRTTRAIERRGEEGARREVDLTSIFAATAQKRMAQIVAEVDKNDDELRKSVATKTYDDGGYPFDAV
jgi:acyl-CoA dehydrogenase family protein 9